MRFERTAPDVIRVCGLDPFLAQLLKMAPGAGEPGTCRTAESRIFPGLCDDAESNEEWRQLVRPELQHLFETSAQTVTRDLESMNICEEPEKNCFEIPSRHIDAWLNCLNRARLVLAERFGFGEAEMAQECPGLPTTAAGLALFQVHFYGVLQECLIAQVE